MTSKNSFYIILLLMMLAGCTSKRDDEVIEQPKQTTIEKFEALEIEEPEEPKASYVYNEYSIDVEIDPKFKTITGLQKINYTNNSNYSMDKIFISVPASDSGGNSVYDEESSEGKLTAGNTFIIKELTVNSEEHEINFEENILEIELEQPLLKQESLVISFSFEGVVANTNPRFGSSNEVLWVSNYFPKVCVFDEYGWHKLGRNTVSEPNISDVANYNVNIKTPSDYSVFGSNIQSVMEKESEAGQEVITTFKEGLIRDFSFAIYDNRYLNVYKKVFDDANTEINFYTFTPKTPENEKKVEELILDITDAMEYLNYFIGNYPYKSLNIYEIPMTHEVGFSNSQAIFLGTNTIFSSHIKRDIYKLVGRQWFGLVVSSDSVREAWISEGLIALLSELILYNEAKASKAVEGNIITMQKNILELNYPLLTTEVSFYKDKEEFTKVQVVRGKILFYSIREKLGVDDFSKFISDIYKNYAFKKINGVDIKKISEEINGSSLEEFFYGLEEDYVIGQEYK